MCVCKRDCFCVTGVGVIWLSSSVLRKQSEQRISPIDVELLLRVGFQLMRQCLDAIIWKVLDLLFVQVDIIMIS